MRKTSQDGGDTTSITSGAENEFKKSGAILKTKRTSIKRKVQSLSHESDDAAIEPLLQKDKEKTDTINPSAKYNLLSKAKTDTVTERDDDKEKLLKDNKTSSRLNAQNISDTIISIPSHIAMPISTGTPKSLHNHMNTNVFNNNDAINDLIAPKTQILVEIDGNKQTGYSTSPLIFTTAKIHTDGKTKHMEPLQVTPVPILSTIELSVLKGNKSGESSGQVTSSNINTIHTNVTKSGSTIPQQVKSPISAVAQTSFSKMVDSKASNSTWYGAPNTDKNMIDVKISQSTAANTTTENKAVSNEEKRDTNGKLTKLSLSQPCSSADKMKPLAPNDKTISANNSKNTTTDLDNTTVEQKTALNQNVKDTESLSAGSDSKSDVTSKFKSNISPTGNKQLQRQKNAVDKDDSSTKLKIGVNSSFSSSNEKNVIKVPIDNVSSTSKLKQKQSTDNDQNSLSDKKKLPSTTANIVQTTANIVQTTSPVTTISTKTPFASVSDAVTKPTISNTPSSMKCGILPISKSPQASSVTEPATTILPSSTAKTSSSNVISSGSNIKSTTTVSSIKLESVAAITTKSSSMATSGTKTAVTPTTTLQSSNVKITAGQPVTKTVDKTTPKAISENSESTTKLPPTHLETAKSTITTGSVKTAPQTASSMKSPPLPSSSAKHTYSPGSTTKPFVSTSSAKNPPASVSTAKTSTVKNNVTAISEANIRLPETGTQALTSAAVAPTVVTATSTPSNIKKNEAKSNELSNGNKSLKA